MGMKDDTSVKNIKNLLNSANTRIEGLKLLQSYLIQCSDEHFIENCTTWMHSCCKLDGFTKHSSIAIQVLNDLIRISASYPQLNKAVSFFITNRFFDYFFKYHTDSEAGWFCLRSCFLFYKGSCGSSHEAIEKHLTEFIRKDGKISSIVAQCFSLLPSVGGGGNEGVIYQTGWRSQFEKFVNLSHSILNDLFFDVEEFQEYNIGGETYKKINDYCSPEYLIIQLYNHCNVLYFMLINKYPVQKYISPDLVLQLICRALGVNSKTIQCCQTTNNIALQKALPEIHIILYSLLNGLITTCKNQLLPYSHLICKLVKQTLEFAETDYFCETEKSHINLKISAYEALCNWLIATKNGSCVESVSKIIISSLIGDIKSKKKVIFLKDAKHKNQSERAVRQNDHLAKRELCCSALKTLQVLLKFSGVSLRVDEHKFLQESVIKLLVDIQNNLSIETGVYSESACRKELYALLMELIHHPCPNWPPPTHFALRIFSRGESDACPEVSQFCSTSLNQLTNIIHPQFSNVTFSFAGELTYNKNEEKLSPEVTNGLILGEIDKPTDEDRKGGYENLETENENRDEELPTRVIAEKEILLEASTCSVGEESDISSHEDSVKTVKFSKNNDEFSEVTEDCGRMRVEKLDVERNEIEEEPASKKKRISDKILLTYESSVVSDKEQPSLLSEGKSSEKIKNNEESVETNIEIKTFLKESCSPQKEHIICSEGSLSEDLISIKSISPELSTEEEKPSDIKKRYFLRSKASKTSSEESEDISRRNNSPDSSLNTPSRNLTKNTPKIDSVKKRPRTRASSKLETIECENESVSPKKDEHDAYEDIMESFDDSLVDLTG